jgi:hypothetical protein
MVSHFVHAFTAPFQGLVDTLKTKCGISLPYNPNDNSNNDAKPKINWYGAIWDTGATNSCITRKIADDLQLKPIGIIETSTERGKRYTNHSTNKKSWT